MQGLVYTVGIRVDGLYDANSDDMWYPGRIQHVHSSDNIDNASYEVLYDDGEVENHVLPQFLRFHVSGTLSVGTRVFGKYAGGDEWYPGKVTEVQENGCYTIEYDDSEVETDVPLEFIKEPAEASFEPTAGDDNEQEAEAAVTGTRDEVVMVSVDYEAVEATAPEVAGLDTVEPVQVVDSTPASQKDAKEASSPQSVDESTTSMSEPQQRVVAIPHQQPIEMERPRFHAKPLDYGSISSSSQPQHQQQGQIIGQHQFETDEYASIVESIELLGKRLADAASIKVVLSTLVKQMRAFPQVTADLVHSRNGEKLVIDVLKFHDSHAVIQCYCFVLLRRLCFLCTKSTHFFLRNEIIGFVTTAMRKFAEDAILQASACGALAVFTRVHAGLNLLLEHRVAQLVLATIVYHKTYSIHTRQVHYYACEVLLELGELGDRTTLDALCGDQVDAGLSDVSPISLLLFLLRQGLSFDDKKACCAVGTLLMCLAANNRYAAGLILRLNGLSELSTVMAKYPSEPGIQKYSTSASKEIALSSIQKPSPARGVKETASEILQESGSLEELHHERFQQQANVRANNSSNRPTVGGRSRTPGAGTGKRKTAPVAIAYPSPTRGQPALSYKDPLSFSKFASPIGKAPYLPSNMTSFTGLTLAQQRNSLVILDGNAPHGSEQLFASSSQASERKQFVKEERQSLLFETYGVQSGGIVRENPGTTTRSQGIKRKQLRTHLVSAAESTWATPIVSPKKLMRDDMLSNPGPYSSGQPFSSRSDALGMGSYASGSQRSYDDGGMDEPMMDDHQYYHHQQQYQQPAYRSSEFSPTPGRSLQQQQQQTVAKKKKKKGTSSSSGGSRESFQIKIESETQLRISKELRSPFASPISPSYKRSKAATSSSKTGDVKSSHGVQRSSTVKKPQLRHDSESLNAYAAKLFNEDFGCLDGDGTNGNGVTSADFVRNSGLSAREQAEIQERERLSFAEKLHKMIDKAKSTLAVSNVASDPMPCFPRSTTSSKSSNGSKSSSSRLPAEISVPHVAVGERLVAPAAKKTRVPSSGTTPRKTAKETTTVAGESSVASTPSELSTSSQSKSQVVESKKHTISGSKISSLPAPKKPLAALPAASTKSYNSATAGSSAVSRTGKPEPGRPVQTPKSASKTKPTVSSSSKSAKPMTPAVPVLSPASAIEEPRDDLVEAEKSADVKEETSQDDITESPMPEPSIELSSEVETQISAFKTEVSTEQGYLDAVPVLFPPQLEQHGESLTADENAAVVESESERPAELQEVPIAPLESEPAPPVQNVSAATTTTNEEEVIIGSVNETTSHEEGTSLVETPGEPAGSVESTGLPPEPIEPASLDPETPADAEALPNPDPESGTENDDVQPSAAVMEEVNASVAVESSSSTSDASPPPPVNEALVDDIYADEYNEFDDDGAGDEATAAEALDEQIVDDADDGHLGGKGSLDDLLSMADQVIGAPQPAAVEPELSAGAEETDAVDAEPSPVPSPEDDNQPPEIDSVEQKTLSSSTSGDDLDAGESGSISASLAEDVKAAREQAVVMDDGLDAATSAAPFEEGIVVSESQIEDRFSAPAEPVAEGLGEKIATAVADERSTATLETSEQPPINRDEQRAPEAMTTEALSESPSSDEVVIDKSAAEDSEGAPSPTEIDETKDSEDTAHRTEVVVSSETEAEESSRESGEAPSAIDEAGESPQAETTANEPVPVSGESVAEEAKAVDERPVSRGVDSYAEDSFDFEPEEEGRSEKATPTEDSDNQKNVEMGESDIEASVPVADAVEPTELPQELVTETEAEADVNQEGDQSVNAGDYQEAAKKAELVVDEEATPAASREPEEADAISEAVLAPAGDEIEPPSASEYTADAERIEEQTSADVTDNPSAEDTAPSDEAAEAAAVDADGTTEEAQGASEDAPVPAEATEATDDADEYGEEYGDADFEETVEGGVQDDGTGDASAPPSVIFAPSEEVSLESVSERYEQLPAEPVPVDEISLEQTDEVVVPASEETTSETTDHPLGDEPAAADTVVDATDDDAVQDVETAPANDDSEPVVESVPEFRKNSEIAGGDATVVSDAQVNVKAEDSEVLTGAVESEQGDAGKYPEIYGEESEFVDEEGGTQTSEPIDATAAELLVYTEVPAPSETEETAQQPADEPAGENSPESSVAVSEDPIVPGDSSAAEEINGDNDESEPTAEPAAAPTVQLDAEQMDHGGQADNLVDEPAYEDDYSGDAAGLAGEEAPSVAPLEVESGEQIVLSVESNADNEGERNSTVDSDPAPSVGGESGTQGGDDLLGGQNTVIEVANEPESSQFTAEDALPDVEDQLPVDSTESVVAVSDGTEEELKLETPAIERVVSSEGKPTSRPDEPDSASVAPEREQESTDADKGYEDYGEFEEGKASQEQQPAADEPQAEVPEATTEPESSSVSGTLDPEMDANPEAISGVGDASSPEEVTELADVIAADSLESAAVDEEVADLQEAAEETISADDDQQEKNRLAPDESVATAGAGREVDEPTAVEAPSQTAALEDENTIAAPEDEANEKDAATDEQAENSKEEVDQPAGDATAEPEATEGMAQESEAPVTSEDAGDEVENSKQLSDGDALTASGEPEATSPQSVKAVSMDADQNSDAQDEEPSTETPASADTDTAEVQSLSEPIDETVEVEPETLNSDEAVSEVEQVSSEESPSGIDSKVTDSEPQAQPSESDTRGDDADGAAHEQQQLEAEAAAEPSEPTSEEKKAAIDEVASEDGGRVQADSVPESERTELEASQPGEVDATDGIASEPEPTQATAEAPTDEPSLLSPPEELPTDEQQSETDEVESPKTDEYDDFEAEAEAIVTEIAPAVEENFPPTPDSADAYDDFEAEAAPVVLQVQLSSDTITSTVGNESPGSDLYDDFEGNDGDEATPTIAAPSESPEEKNRDESSEKPTVAGSEDEGDEYAEETEYNDFEEEDEKPSPPAAEPVAATIESPVVLSTESSPREVEDDGDVEPLSAKKGELKEADEPPADYDDTDYAVEEEEFENEEKSSTTASTLSSPKPGAAMTPAAASASEEKPAAQEHEVENEYEADYDAEYDDFED